MSQYFFGISQVKGTVFFFPGISLCFAHFGEKSSEWVKKPFFFRGGKKKQTFQTSVWVKFKLFLEKKQKTGREKKTSQPCFFFL